MMNMILNFLTYTLIFFLSAGAIGGTVIFFMAATWMQVNDGKEQLNEQKASMQEVINTPSAAKRRRRRTACGYPCQMP